MYSRETVLPVSECLDRLQDALLGHQTVLLTAPTGSGKTTVVPKAILSGAAWLGTRKILMLEPRRIAARLACQWMAEALGEQPGGTIGYRTGLEARVSSATRIEVMTEGILTRRLQNDPELADTALVIFDEVHERHLATDLGLALVRDVQGSVRPDLRILLMSATLAQDTFLRHFPGAPLIESRGRQFPVDITYLSGPPATRLDIAVRDGVTTVLAATEGDVLVFLPGMREIIACEQSLGAQLRPPAYQVCRLHGSMSSAEQDAVRSEIAARRVILATAVAQSSITLGRVDGVVDSGLMRMARFDHASGFTRLVTMIATQDVADQRAGRAGRLRPGFCLRLWTAAEHRGRPRFLAPEIEHTDLAGLALDLSAWGTPDGSALDWLSPPPREALAAGQRLLRKLGLTAPDGTLSPHGREGVAWGLTPRAAAVVAAAPSSARALAVALAALIEEGDGGRTRSDASLAARLATLCAHPQQAPAQRMRRLARRIGVAPWEGAPEATPERLAALLAPAYGDRIGLRMPGPQPTFKLACGPRAQLSPLDPLSQVQALIALAVEETQAGTEIRLATPIPDGLWDDWVETQGRIQVVVKWDESALVFSAAKERRLGDILVSRLPIPLPADADLCVPLRATLSRTGVAILPWSDAARELRARIRWLRYWRPEEDWPDTSDQGLLASLDRWLEAALASPRRQNPNDGPDMALALRVLLAPDQQQLLESYAPSAVTLRSGRAHPLRYPESGPAVVAALLQEFFGTTTLPVLAGGRAPLVAELLSPARRPLQTTADLEGFWRTVYPALRPALAARYRRHHWPLDPRTAQPMPLSPRKRR